MKRISLLLASSFSILLTLAFIDLDNPYNYSNQTKPNYITKDNTPSNNPITNKGATLGRVLFYDKNLSANKQVACASCHIQQFAFGDTATQSRGHLGGLTGRHSMRLVNARFSVEQKFFWDERAVSLEDQTSKPIKDAIEMGYSGVGGQGNIDSLIKRLKTIPYYKVLFPYVFGDSAITESRIQLALAQFVRSIQSFDSKFDAGLAATNNLNAPFPNYTAIENTGKNLFLAPPIAGGAGCQGCHAAPEFDIDPNSKNNGVIGIAGSTPGNGFDLTNTRAPSLRNLFNTAGVLNGPLMHTGAFKTIDAVINHYNNIPQAPVNTNLDPRLAGPGGVLNLDQIEKNALIAFLKTLSGVAIYTDPKWSNPFDNAGQLSISTAINKLSVVQAQDFMLYPNPATNVVNINTNSGSFVLSVMDASGRLIKKQELTGQTLLDLSDLEKGVYYFVLRDTNNGARTVKSLIKE